MSVDSLDFRSELEQALDVELTIDGLRGLVLGNVISALRTESRAMLERLDAGEGTSAEAWAAGVVLRDLGPTLQQVESERLFRELEELSDEDGDPT